ncbi:MAG: MATE family efflux transporter [Lentisphaeria bacterium]|nr:MATE family efflux transporter [Lentisphaeria bacterium]
MTAAKTNNSKYQIDMCRGPLGKQIVIFTVPLILSGILQMLFHSADLIIVGRFASHQALAAVGATGSLTSLIVNIFIGLSVGTNVLVARYIGEKNRIKLFQTTHTAIFVSLAGGVLLAALGLLVAKPILQQMDTPDDVIDMSVLYMKIYFSGMPLIMLYNFGSAILRASGDTKRPFYFLVFSGIINVLLNLFFVLVCRWDVGGVATATVISQAIAAVLVLRVLVTEKSGCRIRLNMLKIDWKILREMMWFGIPAGFQSSCFSIANIMIQTALNGFGSEALAGYTAAATWEAVGYVTGNAFGQAATSFVSQNFGGRQYGRIRQTVKYCAVFSAGMLFVISSLLLIFADPALALFNAELSVIRWGMLRFSIILPFQFVSGIMETLVGALRGLGHVAIPTVIMICCICIFRIIWLSVVFPNWHTMAALIWSYPISWLLAVAANGVCFYYAQKKLCHLQ